MQIEQDRLTGLYTGERIADLLDQEISRVRRYQRPLSVLLIDLILPEERRGALLTASLKRVGILMRDRIRTVDLAGRHGDKILLVLPETDADGARILAGKLKEGLESYTYHGGPTLEGVPIRLRFGIAAVPADGETRGELLEAARSALTQAIEEGGAPSSASGVSGENG